MKLPKLTRPWVNRETTWGGGEVRYVIGADDEQGRRYHVWLYGPKHVSRDDQLFFNAPKGPDGKLLKAGEQGYFATRTLDTSEGRGKAILDALRDICTHAGLFQAADDKAEAEAKATRERQDAAHKLHLKRQAAEELFDALQAAVEAHGPQGDDSRPDWWQGAMDALVKATTDPQPSKEPL